MRILLANLYSANNRGDMLIVRGTLELLRRAWPAAEVFGMTTFRSSSLSYLPDDVDEYRSLLANVFGNPSCVILSPYEASRLSTPQLAVHYGSALLRDLSHLLIRRGECKQSVGSESTAIPGSFDLVVFLGGSYLQTQDRFYANLPGHLYLAYICRATHVDYMFLGVSISRSERVPASLLLRSAFSASSLVVFRDPISLKEAVHNRLVVNDGRRSVWLPDMALGLAQSLKPYRRVRVKRPQVTMGVAFRIWKMNHTHGQKADAVSIMARALSRIVRARPVKVILIPFGQISDSRVDDDVRACTELKTALRALSPEAEVDLCMPSTGHGLSGLVSTFDSIDMSICVRMHAAIFSAMLGIPSVMIEYEGHKSKGVCSYLGLSEYYIEEMTEEQIVAKTLALLEHRESASGNVLRNVDTCYDRLQSTLGELLVPVRSREH